MSESSKRHSKLLSLIFILNLQNANKLFLQKPTALPYKSNLGHLLSFKAWKLTNITVNKSLITPDW